MLKDSSGDKYSQLNGMRLMLARGVHLCKDDQKFFDEHNPKFEQYYQEMSDKERYFWNKDSCCNVQLCKLHNHTEEEKLKWAEFA